ncbi:cache domain-containing sensor histidine kinase [Paenibacillus beijingensis]|uniref:Histidine kinase n=1 Tax=Paenibacillus beijingensis TaxID=1126833 RepID=A0A0D5NPH0_9BACL|nr:sensor histidine kinase [Paenibacillus beijingensis]AJY76912.1 histidine kinase [Paenibacillus beijingensis]
MNLRFKLFAAFFSLIILPLFLLGVASYFIISDTIEKKYAQQTELTLKAVSQSVNFMFREMNKVTDNTVATSALQQLLHMKGYGRGDLTEINYLQLNEIQRNFRDLLINHPSVSYSLLYRLNEKRAMPIYYKDNFTAMPFDKFKRLKLYEEVVKLAGLPKWIGPYEYPQLTGRELSFNQIRMVKDVNTLSDMGVLLVQVKSTGLDDIFRTFRYNRGKHDTRFYIVNGSGLIMFDSTGADKGRNLSDLTEGTTSLGDTYGNVRRIFNGQDSILSSIGLGLEDWRLVSVASWDSLSGEVIRIMRWLVGIVVVCVLSALLFILVFVNRIAKSIIWIVRQMRRVESGDLTVRVQENGRDELFLLSRGFNRQVEKVGELLEQVKRQRDQKNRAELRVLQAQIKPHFLFNTLESINALAVQNKGMAVSQIVRRLGSILRISIQDKEEISVRQEIEHLRSYLDIQKYRFEDLFNYEIDVPEELMDRAILKLTLQPLVENSIQHGFEGIDYTGCVRIRAESAGNDTVFWIEDNGLGIERGTLAKFQYMFSEEQQIAFAAPPLSERRGLGVRSVADRLRIQYGRRYGLFICSEPGGGTVIKCTIPNYFPE